MDVLHQMLAEWHMFWSFDAQKSVRIHWNCRQVDAACSCLRHSVSQGCFKGFCYKICHVEMAFLFAMQVTTSDVAAFPIFPHREIDTLLAKEAMAEPVVDIVQPLRSAALQHFLSWEGSLFMAEADKGWNGWKLEIHFKHRSKKKDSGFHIGFLMGFMNFSTESVFWSFCGLAARQGYEKALKCSCTTRLHSYGESFSMHKIKIWPQFSGVDFASRLSCLSPLFEKDTFGKSKSTEDTSNFIQENWDQSQVWASASIPELRQRLVVAM